MDVTAVSQPVRAAIAPVAEHTPMAKGPPNQSTIPAAGAESIVTKPVVDMKLAMETAARRLTQALAADGAVVPKNTDAVLIVDDGSRRVVARLIDRDSGEVVREYPPDELLRLFAKTREQFQHLFLADV
ncbi:MAG: flagellar protein FlaG [Dongiaceae bacterium]